MVFLRPAVVFRAAILCSLVLFFPSPSSAQYSEDFDGELSGALLINLDEDGEMLWDTWDDVDDDTLSGIISDAQSVSTSNSVSMAHIPGRMSRNGRRDLRLHGAVSGVRTRVCRRYWTTTLHARTGRLIRLACRHRLVPRLRSNPVVFGLAMDERPLVASNRSSRGFHGGHSSCCPVSAGTSNTSTPYP